MTSIINNTIPSPLCTGFFSPLLICVANGSPGQSDKQDLLQLSKISNYDKNILLSAAPSIRTRQVKYLKGINKH